MPEVVVPVAEKEEVGVVKEVGGRRVRGATVKQLKKMLKKAGLKTSGKRAALTRRAKKAHLKMKGGEVKEGSLEKVAQGGGASVNPYPIAEGQAGGRRRSRRSRGLKLW